MKRVILIIICVFGLSAYSFAQEIPNGDMEDWAVDSFFNIKSQKPVGWFTYNIPNFHFGNVPYGVSKTTESHSGDFALRIGNTDIFTHHPVGIGNITEKGMNGVDLKRGAPFSSASVPTKVCGYFKGKLTNPEDTTSIRVYLYEENQPFTNPVALARVDFVHPMVKNEYVYFEKEIELVSNDDIDSIYIEINMSRLSRDEEFIVTGDFIILDDLSFNCLSDDVEEPLREYDIQVYPNPTSDKVNIAIEPSLVDNSQVVIFDAAGKKWKSQKLTSTVTTISLVHLPKKTFYQILDQNQKVITNGQLLNLE